MKIKIGSLEISELTMDELHALVDRYAGKTEAIDQGGKKHESHPGNGNGGGSGSHADRVVLEKLVSAGSAGASTQDVGEVLGHRGKSIRRGLLAWAKRIGLVQDDGIDPFEDCRADGTRRGVRIKASLLPVAQKLLANT